MEISNELANDTDSELFTIKDSIKSETLNKFHLSFFIVIYGFIFFMSLLGNVLILIIIFRRKRMRSANNYFLTNITISNILYTICAPFPFIIELNSKNESEWIFYDFLCPIIPLLSTLAINLNTITMIVSSIDRLIVIICPFRLKLSKRKCFYIILFIWILSILFSLPWSYLIRVQENNKGLDDQEQENIDYDLLLQSSSKLCIPLNEFNNLIRIYCVLLFMLQYLLPLIVLIITYSIITYYINVINAKSIKRDENKSNIFLRRKNEKKVNFN